MTRGRIVYWEVSIVSNAGAESCDITLGATGLWRIHEANVVRTSGAAATAIQMTLYREGLAFSQGKIARVSATAGGGSYVFLRGPASSSGQAGQPVDIYTSNGTIRQRMDISAGASGDTFLFNGVAEYLGPVASVTATEV